MAAAVVAVTVAVAVVDDRRAPAPIPTPSLEWVRRAGRVLACGGGLRERLRRAARGGWVGVS